MPPKHKFGKSTKAKSHKAKSEKANTVKYHGGAAYQFSAPRDDEYVHSGSSLSDAESAEEERGDTSPGTIIYIKDIYYVTRIDHSSRTSTPKKEHLCWKVHPSGYPSKSSIQQLVVSACPMWCCCTSCSLGPIPIVDFSTMPIIATSAFIHSCDNSLSLLFVVVDVVDITIAIAISLSNTLHWLVVI
jgi:hypothetical protein